MTCYDRLQYVRQTRNQARLKKAEVIVVAMLIFCGSVYFGAHFLAAHLLGRIPG